MKRKTVFIMNRVISFIDLDKQKKRLGNKQITVLPRTYTGSILWVQKLMNLS